MADDAVRGYDTSVDYARFQVAVVELADEGTRLTTANIVARLRIDPAEAERHVARMVRERRLEIEDDDDGVPVYRVRGLSPRGGRGDASLSSLKDAAVSAVLAERVSAVFRRGRPLQTGGAPLPMSMRRSVPRGVLLGCVLPGLGLAYAAPWPIVAVGTLVVVVGFKVLAWISLLFAVPFLIAAAVLSGILGGLYTWQYNQMGRRAPLGEDPDGSRKLPTRIKL